MRSRDPGARLAERALREGWPVPAERRAGLVEVLIGLAEDPATGARERISAVKALLMASRVNLEALKASMVAGEYELLVGRLAALGGDVGGGSASDGEGGSDG